jgi:anti-sigma-K factor RskA
MERLLKMPANHPETALVPYLRGELSAYERDQIKLHLEQCAQCRKSAESSLAILSQLAGAVDDVRTPEWMQYRLELRHKLRAAQTGRVGVPERWRRGLRLPIFSWPSMAIGAAVVAVLAIVLVMHRGTALQTPGVDQLEMPQEMSDADIGLLANYHVVERLDLLENYDVIEHLDELAPGNHPNHETSS